MEASKHLMQGCNMQLATESERVADIQDVVGVNARELVDVMTQSRPINLDYK